MPHALLLSPDDQAVSAITGVLEELSVTCERPMDGPSAAKKLSAQSFDLVLVDCENLPAAKLIFDVCRRAPSGGNPVPIAIVDGRAGLPTAFRLGAELILTKPVAKDQARTTIRTAVSRLKKDEPTRPAPFEATPAEIPQPAASETRAQAAVAGASSTAASRSVEATPSAASPEPPVAKMQHAIEEAPAPRPRPMPSRDLSLAPGTAAPVKPVPPAKASTEEFSEDPVIADLDAQTDVPTPVFTSYKEPVKKKGGQGSLILLLVLMLAGGGFYAAWMYQPGFRETVQPQIDRVLSLIGMPPAPQSTPPVRPVAPPAPAPAPVPKSTAPTTAPASDSPSDTTQTSEPAAPPAKSSDAEPAAAPTAVPAATAETPALDTTKPAASDKKKNTIVALPSDTELPGEKSAVILSSQGAEKRLLRHPAPVYPAEARKERIEGTVVLKVVVSETGRVDGVRLVEGNPTLAAAAIPAVKQWHYRPYLRDGKTQPFQTIVLVEFQRP